MPTPPIPHVYLIGGAPRSGKTTLALQLAKRKHLHVLSTDTLRAVLRQATPPSVEPDLFYLDSLNTDEAGMARLMRESTADIIAAADRESRIVWPAVEDVIRSRAQTEQDLIIEGVAVLPECVAGLDLDYSVVHLGNQSPDHAKIIEGYARTHPNTWLGTLQPETVAAFAHFTRAYSAHVQQQAHVYRQPYVEMSRYTFTEALRQTARLFEAA